MSIDARFRITYPGFALAADLELPGRGVSALFGPSGSGKTTLLRAIAGLERWPDARLIVNGETWQDGKAFVPTHRRPLGYVFQQANLFAHLTVRGNLDYGARRAGAAAARVDRERIVELLGISALLERKPERLSGGEGQRVAIARALLSGPQLLLMDEPLAALDLARRNEILPYLENLRDTLDIPVLYVSHAADEVARLADHLVVLDAGRILAQGPLAETLARVDLPIRLGEDAGVVLDAVVVERDRQWSLARVDFPGGELWVRDSGHTIGSRVRVRILARDVSITLERHEGSSIMNTLPARVAEIGDEADPALALIRLHAGAATPENAPEPAGAGSSAILARLTRRSVAWLGLAPGMPVWAQIKAVALIG
ncbi:molybdenum ABC transporter ATP-binding protein [Rhodocyclus purpureus]|uniref:molybdenum ABC transporter ATP-binding protein n=1 Tax=Rhodocyclus purpureus TaxID=1067 RepID=UPI001913E40D|nr:molybdenum ABC transporter ATP-binding protein [Rhodocyclus purpureus]MBK5914466.1 molybdenum ABC transporter ATP-binding protein [Rhodocyclus purpureus]